MKSKLLLCIVPILLLSVGCRTLKKEFIGDDKDQTKFDTRPYDQTYAGQSVGEFTYETTLAYAPGLIETKWTYYKWVRIHNPLDPAGVYYEELCAGNSYSDNFAAEQAGRTSPYAIVKVDGANLVVTFKGMNPEDKGCWSIKSTPMQNLMESNHVLY